MIVGKTEKIMNSRSYQLPHSSKHNQPSHYTLRQPQSYQQSSEIQFQPPPYKRFPTQVNPRIGPILTSNFFAHLAGLASILAALGVFIYLFFSFAVPDHYIMSAPAATLNNYCDALKRHDYQAAYDQLLTPTAEFPDEADFAAPLHNADKVFGGLTRCTVYAVNENDSSGVADGTFSLTYNNGAAEFFTTRLAVVGGTWKITAID